MANEKDPTPGTRGYRINELRNALGLNREAFADALAAVAEKNGLNSGGKWTQTRVSQTILSRKPIPLDDVAAIVLLARERGLRNVSWDWIVFGERRAAKPITKPAAPAKSSRDIAAAREAK